MEKTAAARRAHVALIMSTALCVGLSIGLFPALLALNVEARGYDSSWNGLLAAMHGVAGLVVSPFAPRLMAAMGPLRTYLAAVIFACIMVVSFTLLQRIELWFVLRFALGLGLGIQWIVSETWMNQIAQGPRRGTIISTYILVLTLGMAMGPLIMTGIGVSGAAPFLVTAALLALSSIPVAMLPSSPVGAGREGEPLALWAAVRRKPSAMLAAAIDGFIFQAFMALLPIYFLRLGSPQDVAISMLNGFLIGALALQMAVGYLLDHTSPAKVLFGSSLILLVGLLVTAFPSIGGGWIWLALFLMGGPAASVFTAGLASINDAFTSEEMPSGTAAFTMVWHTGGLAGPAIAGLSMDLWNPYGFAAAAAGSLVVLGIANVWELLKRPAAGRDSNATVTALDGLPPT